MKFNQFNKSEQLLAYMRKNYLKLRVSDDVARLIDVGITSSAKALSSMLSSLKAKGFVVNDSYGYWDLTCTGIAKSNSIISALDSDEDVPDLFGEDDEPSDFGNDQQIMDAQMLADKAKRWSDIAAKYAAIIGNDNDSLQKTNSLRAENEALKQEIDELKNENIRNCAVNSSLSSANAALHRKILELEKTLNDRREYQLKLCDKLAAETKERERLEKKLARVANECKNMSIWAENMSLN